LNKDMVAFYAYLGESSNTSYDFFTESYEILETDLEGDFAFIDLYENLDFKYSDVDFTSSASPHYFISLVKFNGEWFIMAVESDDSMYEVYRDSEFDLQQHIENFDNAQDADIGIELSEEHESRDIESYDVTMDRLYDRSNAANYALTYCKKGDMGNGSYSSWKNDNFHYGSNNCMRFVSQCLWAGFGGSNDTASIQACKAMDRQDENGTDKLVWFGRNVQSGLTTESHSWISVSVFDLYIHHKYLDSAGNPQTASSSEDRMRCSTYEVARTQNQMLSGSSNTNNYKLLGAAGLIIKPNQSIYSHAILITQVKDSSGVATRDTVYFTAYNGCYKNYKLSAVYYKGQSSNTGYELEVVMPGYLQNGNPSGDNYFYGELMPTLTTGSSKVVTAKARDTASTMCMYIYKPNASTASYSFYGSNCSTLQSSSITFNQTGLWRVVIRSSNSDPNPLATYTFTIRVASSTEAGNDPEP
jgi:hypothetical protein